MTVRNGINLQVAFHGVDTQMVHLKPWNGKVLLDGDAIERPLQLEPDHRVLSTSPVGGCLKRQLAEHGWC